AVPPLAYGPKATPSGFIVTSAFWVLHGAVERLSTGVPPPGPGGPGSPLSPLSPLSPFAPVAPVAPVAPLAPWPPCAPRGPAGPAGPAGPFGPRMFHETFLAPFRHTKKFRSPDVALFPFVGGSTQAVMTPLWMPGLSALSAAAIAATAANKPTTTS